MKRMKSGFRAEANPEKERDQKARRKRGERGSEVDEEREKDKE